MRHTHVTVYLWREPDFIYQKSPPFSMKRLGPRVGARTHKRQDKAWDIRISRASILSLYYPLPNLVPIPPHHQPLGLHDPCHHHLHEHSLPFPNPSIRIIPHIPHVKNLSRRLHKSPIRPPPLLKTKITHRLLANQLFHRLQQQWERRFKVHAVGC